MNTTGKKMAITATSPPAPERDLCGCLKKEAKALYCHLRVTENDFPSTSPRRRTHKATAKDKRESERLSVKQGEIQDSDSEEQ